MKSNEKLTEARLALEAELGDDENRNYFIRAVLRTVEIALDQNSCIIEYDRALQEPIAF